MAFSNMQETNVDPHQPLWRPPTDTAEHRSALAANDKVAVVRSSMRLR